MDLTLRLKEKDRVNVSKWIGDIGSNTRALWDVMVPIIKDGAKLELSDANPNNWEPLKEKYLQWKLKKGYPATIGVRKGFLKTATIVDPIIIYKDKSLLYQVNSEIGIANEGKDYFHWFHRKRPLFQYTTRYTNELYKDAVRNWIKGSIQKRPSS